MKYIATHDNTWQQIIPNHIEMKNITIQVNTTQQNGIEHKMTKYNTTQ